MIWVSWEFTITLPKKKTFTIYVPPYFHQFIISFLMVSIVYIAINTLFKKYIAINAAYLITSQSNKGEFGDAYSRKGVNRS